MVNYDFGGTLQWLVDFVIHFSADFLGFIVIALIIGGFAIYFGRDRLMSLTAALYAAIPLYNAFPYTDFITTPLLSIALYVFLVLAGIIAFSGLSAFMASSSLEFLNVIVLSVVTAGMIIAVSIHILPVQEFYTFSAPTQALFASSEAFFLWLVAPLVGLYFLGR